MEKGKAMLMSTKNQNRLLGKFNIYQRLSRWLESMTYLNRNWEYFK